jgi:N-methylhydantoinase A/oxoprolinase/acetone carboxylase beta subunit
MQPVGNTAASHLAVSVTAGNDGTLITSAQAQQHPILTFKSGPVNSVRGAAALTGLTNTLVMDIGGTTTDTAAVVAGLPRMSGSLCDICGVTTSFR